MRALLFILLILPQLAFAASPKEVVKERVDAVIAILKDPRLQGAEKEGIRRERIKAVVKGVFDFEEMSRRSLGRYWRRATEGERKRFVDLFTKLLERQYLDKLNAYHNEKILYTKEKVRGRIALVKTLVISQDGTEIPIDYRMVRRDGRWYVYDIVVEGVSLVANYNSQFREILRKSSMEALLKDLERKVERD